MSATITKEEFLRYEGVRKSGRVNMFDVKNVMILSGLTREKIVEIMAKYANLSQEYLKEELLSAFQH